MAALALVSDLVMQSQISAAAARTGVAVEIAGAADALVARLEAVRPRLVVLDLSHAGLDPHQLVPRLKDLLTESATLVAFGPHVHKQRLNAAVEAGCNVVISRGQFHAEMDEILKRYAG